MFVVIALLLVVGVHAQADCTVLTAWQPTNAPWVIDAATYGSSCCSWPSYVACNANQRVTSIEMGGLNLNGTLSASWSSITELETLNLENNALSGTLPATWSALTQLVNLLAYSNAFQGTLPSSWSTMTELQDLQLQTNKLSGALPSSWSTFTQLTTLHMNDNSLNGTLPPEWSALSTLQYASLYNNQFSGTLPANWSSMTSLQQLYLYDNELSGTLPQEWSALTQITYLQLGFNKLNGTLPAAWSAIKTLQTLFLGYNQLNGTLPQAWSALTNLHELDLQINYFTGTLPDSWRAMANIEYLFVNSNGLNGTLPSAWSALTSLVQFYISTNEFVGTLPDSWSSFTKMQDLYLYSNRLNGTLPAAWGAMTALRVLDAHSNDLTGQLPSEWSALKNLQSLSMQSNDLGGTLPSNWSAMTSLTSVALCGGSTRYCGGVPSAWLAVLSESASSCTMAACNATYCAAIVGNSQCDATDVCSWCAPTATCLAASRFHCLTPTPTEHKSRSRSSTAAVSATVSLSRSASAPSRSSSISIERSKSASKIESRSRSPTATASFERSKSASKIESRSRSPTATASLERSKSAAKVKSRSRSPNAAALSATLSLSRSPSTVSRSASASFERSKTATKIEAHAMSARRSATHPRGRGAVTTSCTVSRSSRSVTRSHSLLRHHRKQRSLALTRTKSRSSVTRSRSLTWSECPWVGLSTLCAPSLDCGTFSTSEAQLLAGSVAWTVVVFGQWLLVQAASSGGLAVHTSANVSTNGAQHMYFFTVSVPPGAVVASEYSIDAVIQCASAQRRISFSLVVTSVPTVLLVSQSTYLTMAAVTTAAAVASASSASAVNIARAGLMQQVALCNASAANSLVGSVLGIGFGSTQGYYERGGVVGNVGAVAAVVAVLFVVGLLLTWRDPGVSLAERVHLPSAICVPAGAVLQPTLDACIGLLNSAAVTTDYVIAIFGLLCCAGFTAYCGVTLFHNFRCQLMRVEATRGAPVPLPLLVRVAQPTWRWTCEADPPWKRRHMLVFADSRSRLYTALDLLVSVVLGLVIGIPPTSSSVCEAQIIVLLLAFALMTAATLWLMPAMSLFGNAYRIVLNVLGLASSISLLIAQSTNATLAANGALVSATMILALTMIKSVGDATSIARAVWQLVFKPATTTTIFPAQRLKISEDDNDDVQLLPLEHASPPDEPPNTNEVVEHGVDPLLELPTAANINNNEEERGDLEELLNRLLPLRRLHLGDTQRSSGSESSCRRLSVSRVAPPPPQPGNA